jgi:rsbT co-antagonist protein RsbR
MNKYEQFKILYEVSEDDYVRIRQFSEKVKPSIDIFIDRLYTYLRHVLGAEFHQHFADEKAVTRAQSMARRGWLEFLDAKWDEIYINSRIRIGEVHAQIQIEPHHYLATMDKAVNLLLDLSNEKPVNEKTTQSIRRVARMESAFVVDVYSRRTKEIISKQNRALTDMSTPITAIWDGILMLPVVGIVDSKRAQDIMQRMLEQISIKRAMVFILDISGVAVVDTAVANHFIRMTKAARLMGSYTIVSGLSPAVAQTIVELGIEVGEMRTTGNLQDALHIAFERMGLEHTFAKN